MELGWKFTWSYSGPTFGLRGWQSQSGLCRLCQLGLEGLWMEMPLPPSTALPGAPSPCDPPADLCPTPSSHPVHLSSSFFTPWHLSSLSHSPRGFFLRPTSAFALHTSCFVTCISLSCGTVSLSWVTVGLNQLDFPSHLELRSSLLTQRLDHTLVQSQFKQVCCKGEHSLTLSY